MMEINKDAFLQEMAKQRNKAVEDATRRIEREHGFVSGLDYALNRILDYFHEREEKEKSDAEGAANDWQELSADEMSGTQLKQAVRFYRKMFADNEISREEIAALLARESEEQA